MDRLAAGPQGDGGAGLSRRTKWILGAVLGLLFAAITVAYLGRIKAFYQLYWGQDELGRLFYEDVGMSDAWSSFIAVVASFFFAIAWVPLSLWTWRLLIWRFNVHQLLITLACWVLIYGHVPLIHALLATDACFNQRTGEPLKWYAEQPNGDIILFDSGGYDSVWATQKLPVTPAICATFARQRAIGRPHRLTADVHSIEFFDPNTGRARVWYSKAPDGSFILFDSNGFNPSSGEKLFPVTKEGVDEILRRAAKEVEDARQLATKEARERTEREVQERAGREAQIAIAAEQTRQAAAREAQAKAEADRKAVAAKQAEEAEQARQAAAREAQAKAEAVKNATAAKQAEGARQRTIVEAQAKQAYNHGIGRDTSTTLDTSPYAQSGNSRPGDLRARFRSDSIRMSAGPVDVDFRNSSNPFRAPFRASFAIENHSGMPVEIAIVGKATYGPCDLGDTTGVTIIDHLMVNEMKTRSDRQSRTTYIPDNGRAVVSGINWSACHPDPNRNYEFSASIAVFVEREGFVISLSASARSQ